MNSIWSQNTHLPKFKSLPGDITTEILIIGGGIAGILCAYFLERQGISYVLVEGKTICSGITKNTTAKITAQHGLIYDKLIKKSGIKQANQYYEANQTAVNQYFELCKDIDCNFEEVSAYVYSLKNRKKLENEVSALEKLGAPVQLSDTAELPFDTVGAVKLDHQAQFDPLKFVDSIVKNLNIYENTFVKQIQENTAITDKGNITAKKIIVATHFPFDNKHGMYFLKMYQHRSYVIALANAAKINGVYVDEAMCGMSFRSFEDLLLIGGGDHRTGKHGGNWAELREFAKKYYPNAKEKYFWATQDCMTLDSIPYIGYYSKNTPDLLVATGFNKWGITSGMVAAMILSDLVTGKENPYAAVFSPSRSMMKPQLLVNGFEATINLLTFTKKRCPHLGCALKWNDIEHSWDCPCHGSRFDENGKVLDNPANGDMK